MQLLTIRDVAEKTKLSQSFIYKNYKRLFPFVLLGKRIRFREEDIEDYILSVRCDLRRLQNTENIAS
jgi:predicted DNA-binding transcriptional regulator AlpA